MTSSVLKFRAQRLQCSMVPDFPLTDSPLETAIPMPVQLKCSKTSTTVGQRLPSLLVWDTRWEVSRTPMLIGCTCGITKFYLPILPKNIHLQSSYLWLSGNPLNAIFIKQVLDHKGNTKVKCSIICFYTTDTWLSPSESRTVQFLPKNFPRVLTTVCTAGTSPQES